VGSAPFRCTACPISWELSNTIETGFCLAALEAAFRFGQSELWNSDQRTDVLMWLKRDPNYVQRNAVRECVHAWLVPTLWIC
jgi:hypothetical protein